jgi:hypothetical protein
VVQGDKLLLDSLEFPFVVCLNQECDLESDYISAVREKDNCLLHLAIAPAFLFEHFLSGTHWGKVFENSAGGKRKDTLIKKIVENEIPRYHYLLFPDPSMPELIIDFKHFFTVNRDLLYLNLQNRLCSIDDLFREKISQRFCNYVSRIGLPEE